MCEDFIFSLLKLLTKDIPYQTEGSESFYPFQSLKKIPTTLTFYKTNISLNFICVLSLIDYLRNKSRELFSIHRQYKSHFLLYFLRTKISMIGESDLPFLEKVKIYLCHIFIKLIWYSFNVTFTVGLLGSEGL